ncbi:MAG: cbb3-type cytochrome c oxidase subunit I [Deltaproteobacteria bacterium]|nr:cbb3-type cytochrome c oxidase subunit I [Deltaproteobacteria bacterium]
MTHALTGAPPFWLPGRFLVAAIGAFLLATTWSLFAAADLADFYYHVHVLALTHLVTLGWITMTIMGAMYQLVPVALQARLWSARLGPWQFWLYVVGVAGMVVHFWIGEFVGMAGSALFVLAGLLIFLVNMAATLARAGLRDLAARHLAAALVYLLGTAVLGVLLALDKTLGFLRGEFLGLIAAHAHLAALGWVTMTIFGVSYKLIPMFTLSAVQQPRLAAWQFWLFNVGLLGVFWSLFLSSPFTPLFAAVAGAAILLHAIQVLAILRQRKRPPLDLGIIHALTALGYLVLLVPVGLLLATGLLPDTPFRARVVAAYGFLGLMGWVSLTIVGMLYKIVPFLVWYHCYSARVGLEPVPVMDRLYSRGLQRAGYWLLNLGITGTAAGLLAGDPQWLAVGLGLLAVGAWTFGINMGMILSRLFTVGRRARVPPAACSAGSERAAS